MQDFLYICKAEQKRIVGITSSVNISEARKQMLETGVALKSIKQIKPLPDKLFWELLDRLAILIRQGYNVTDSLHFLVDDDDSQFGELSVIILRRLEKGTSLSDCLHQTFKSLPSVVLAIIRTSEQTSQLEQACTLLLKKHKSTVRRQRQTRVILAYPTVVLIATIGVTWVLLDLILPGLKEALPNQADLPLTSRVVLSLSGKFGSFVEAAIWCTVLILFSFFLCTYHLSIKTLLDRYIIRIPFTRYFVISLARGQFFEVLKLGLDSELPLLKAISLASASTNNSALCKLCNHAQDQIRQGILFSKAMEQTGLLSRRELSQITAAERTSQLEKTVGSIAREIEEKRDNFASIISQITGPIFIVLIGSIIFTIAMAIVMPMMTMQAQLESLVK